MSESEQHRITELLMNRNIQMTTEEILTIIYGKHWIKLREKYSHMGEQITDECFKNERDGVLNVTNEVFFKKHGYGYHSLKSEPDERIGFNSYYICSICKQSASIEQSIFTFYKCGCGFYFEDFRND